jgi:hypothetical protein
MNRRILFIAAIILAGAVAIVYFLTTRLSFSFNSSVQIDHNGGEKVSATAPNVQRQLFFPSTTIRIPVSKGGPWIPPASRKRVYGDPRGPFLDRLTS